MPDFPSKPSYEVARRLNLRGGKSYSWFVLLKPGAEGEAGDAIQDLAEELDAFVGRPRIVDVTGLLVDELRGKLQEPPSDPVILVGFDDRTPEFWSSIDVNRSGLERSGTVVFWLSPSGLSQLCTHAPNLRSFVGGSIFAVGAKGGQMSEEERTHRLHVLSSFYGLTNDEIIRRAESRQLPPEPEFVEWLVLLGRGDLV